MGATRDLEELDGGRDAHGAAVEVVLRRTEATDLEELEDRDDPDEKRAQDEQADGELHRPRGVLEQTEQIEAHDGRIRHARRVAAPDSERLERRHCASTMSTRRSRAQPGSSYPVASIAPRVVDSVFALSRPLDVR